MKAAQATSFLCLLLPLLAGGCLPEDAPSSSQVLSGAVATSEGNPAPVSYALVKSSPAVVEIANRDVLSAETSGRANLPTGPGAQAPIGIGDILAVQIFEAQSGGLFNPHEPGGSGTRSNFVQLPNQQVDAEGYIAIPYGGNIKAAGLTAKQFADMIVDRLRGRAIDPQAVVTISERRSSEVSVLGEVTTAGRFALDPGGMRISEAVAKSGGSKWPDYETYFILDRHGSRFTGQLSAIIDNPRQDVQLSGGDVLYLSHVPKYVMVFGATLDPTLTSITRRVTFESRRLSLAEALAKAGGLNTARAEASYVFVLRNVGKPSLNRMNTDTAPFSAPLIPTVFSFDLSKADGFFLGDSFQMENRDVILVSESPYEAFTKAFTLLNTISLTPIDVGAVVGQFNK